MFENNSKHLFVKLFCKDFKVVKEEIIWPALKRKLSGWRKVTGRIVQRSVLGPI